MQMHVGFSPVFQNISTTMSDQDCIRNELALCDLAEPLGFESIWQPEHHFSGYEMTPNVLQFLTYMAGRTKHVRLGSMVVVLPWHNPVRVVEDIIQLDHFSGGRAILGMGRGLGANEFGGFGIDMNHTRAIFTESAEAIVDALKTGIIEYNGEHIKQARRVIRPAPFKSFEGRIFGAGLSPETMPLLARLGVGSMIFPLKSWDEVRTMLGNYRNTWAASRPGTVPARSVLVSFCYVHKDRGKAKDRAYKYIGAYFKAVVEHYDMGGANYGNAKGYEYYAQNAESYHDMKAKTEEFVELLPWGTPDEYMEKLQKIDGYMDMGALLAHFSFGNMPYDMAEENMRLFAESILPELKKWDKGSFAEPASP
jgi:alkanesulfonate monooxygenase SsuD/methylene tetrahydromethanopterin reductase-like flavin-dependent oxidoreductase (luciferase family)